MMTRRTFLGVAAAVTAAGGLGLGGSFLQKRRLALAELASANNVLPPKGTAVVLRGPDGNSWRAEVSDVRTTRRPARPGAPGTEQVSLLLKPADRNAPGGNYRLESDDVRVEELHFSPVNQPGRDRRLEAVITRIV